MAEYGETANVGQGDKGMVERSEGDEMGSRMACSDSVQVDSVQVTKVVLIDFAGNSARSPSLEV